MRHQHFVPLCTLVMTFSFRIGSGLTRVLAERGEMGMYTLLENNLNRFPVVSESFFCNAP